MTENNTEEAPRLGAPFDTASLEEAIAAATELTEGDSDNGWTAIRQDHLRTILDAQFSDFVDPDDAPPLDKSWFETATRHGPAIVTDALVLKSRAWDGLARSIMMWLDFDYRTPRMLFAHLEATGVEIPDWLRAEPEMQHVDHVPSKGTRAYVIWRAVHEAALGWKSDALAGEDAVHNEPASDGFTHEEWLYIAKAAGANGIRYATNRGMEEFIAALKVMPRGA